MHKINGNLTKKEIENNNVCVKKRKVDEIEKNVGIEGEIDGEFENERKGEFENLRRILKERERCEGFPETMMTFEAKYFKLNLGPLDIMPIEGGG